MHEFVREMEPRQGDQIQTAHLLMETRVCRVCGEEKELLTEYYLSRKDPTLKSSYSYECRACCIKRTTDYNLKNRPHIKDNHLKRTYGITLTEFNERLDEQNGGCAICGTTEPGGKWKNFHVDHNHETRKVRGLLCNSCNVTLGVVKEDIHTLKSMIEYLEIHE